MMVDPSGYDLVLTERKRTIQQHVDDVPFLVESWLFDAAMSIISRCDGWAGQVVGEDPEMKPFVQVRPQILQIMVSQVREASFMRLKTPDARTDVTPVDC